MYEGDARAAARSGESDARDGWKTYGITDLSSDDAAVMMRSFVKHAVLPPADAYVDMHETGSAEKKEAFTAVWQSYCSA